MYTRRVDNHVMMWIQIHARGVREHPPLIFFLKWRNPAHSECPKIRYYKPKNQQFYG